MARLAVLCSAATDVFRRDRAIGFMEKGLKIV